MERTALDETAGTRRGAASTDARRGRPGGCAPRDSGIGGHPAAWTAVSPSPPGHPLRTASAEGPVRLADRAPAEVTRVCGLHGLSRARRAREESTDPSNRHRHRHRPVASPVGGRPRCGTGFVHRLREARLSASWLRGRSGRSAAHAAGSAASPSSARGDSGAGFGSTPSMPRSTRGASIQRRSRSNFSRASGSKTCTMVSLQSIRTQ